MKEFKYAYPKMSGGYRFNTSLRCLHEVGIQPITISDVGNQTFFWFDRELTEAEKVKLDALASSNPTLPPNSAGTVFKIDDIWEVLDKFKQTTGIDFKLYYSESIPGSGKIDKIELHAPSVLTAQQINKVKTAYANLMSNG